MDTDVVVAGAGPTGLLLANELALAGVDAVVLDRLPARSGQSRALNLQPRTAEILHLRGWLEPIREHALAVLDHGHFAGIPLDYTGFDTPFPYQVGIPQARVEEFLERRLGSTRWGCELTAFTQDPDGVTVTAGGLRIRGKYLVGADGGRSTVRRLLGVDFPGRDARIQMVVADVELTGVDDRPWEVPNFTPSERGAAHVVPLGEGTYRILFGGPEQQGLDRSAPVTDAEVQAAVTTHVPGARFRRTLWASRFTDAARQVTQYVHGRVLLAGDAAHIHLPAGGQGLNLGMQDAFNLGWKLAAVVRGDAGADLLGTYHTERHPVAADVLRNTMAQGVLLVPDPDIVALRGLVTDMLGTPDANRLVSGMISGLDIHYDMTGSPPHPLLGHRYPGITLPDGRGAVLRRGHEVVVVRPDGHVCWAGPAGYDLTTVLDRWGMKRVQPEDVRA
ncbi:FAD-dependent monooxygenase [Kibdelosporangium lantanae]